MKRLTVRGLDWGCNMPVTKIDEQGDSLHAFNNDELVGIFDLSAIYAVYVTEQRETEKNESTSKSEG